VDEPLDLVGGVVAHNEENTIGPAVRSLLDQDLGDRARWSAVWIVASGCTDRTVERARELSQQDARVHLVEDPERRGKNRAVNQVLERARGDCLVLLNGDAFAEAGAVRALLEAARGVPAPYAVMGRPVPPSAPTGDAFAEVIELQWRLHDELHREALRDGAGNHLSDELLLLSLPSPTTLSEGTINDGAYLGAMLALRGGGRRYAPEAGVRVQVPATVMGYLTQRRRIYAGHARVAFETGVVPTTLLSLAAHQPRRAWRVLSRCWKVAPQRDRFPQLVLLELLALGLATFDGLPPRRDHVRWRRVPVSRSGDGGNGSGAARSEASRAKTLPTSSRSGTRPPIDLDAAGTSSSRAR
jgi:hypothetical protein